MNIFKKWFQRKKTTESYEIEEENWEDVILDRSNVVMFVKEQRDNYVINCLDQIKVASEEVEQLGHEYNLVTAYLKDMEEIEALPEEELAQIRENAQKIVSLEGERKNFKGNKKRMSEEQFRKIERLEEEADVVIAKLRKAEEYQLLVKQDLSRLDGEKHAYKYRRAEVQSTIENTKGMAMICACALAACFTMLLVLQFTFQMDTKIGYFVAALVGALVITVIYTKHLDEKREYISIDKSIYKIVGLQNKVKIRYVNNTNLLDYFYLKYQVGSAKELEFLWNKYKKEKEERNALRQSGVELDFYQRELIKILVKFQLSDPQIWVHQAEALLENREMVEIRHHMIIRRQKLRKQIEDNQELAETAQQEIKKLVEEYPKYAKEILEIVSKYEKSA